MEEFDYYGPKDVDVMRPPIMTAEQMQRVLLHVTSTNEIVYLPTGRIRTFDGMRRWAGWTPETRGIFDAWAQSNSRQSAETIERAPSAIVGQSTGQFWSASL